MRELNERKERGRCCCCDIHTTNKKMRALYMQLVAVNSLAGAAVGHKRVQRFSSPSDDLVSHPQRLDHANELPTHALCPLSQHLQTRLIGLCVLQRKVMPSHLSNDNYQNTYNFVMRRLHDRLCNGCCKLEIRPTKTAWTVCIKSSIH